MALSTGQSDQNLFDDLDENELDQIFNITDGNKRSLSPAATKTENMDDDDASESSSEIVYIEPIDEENDNESLIGETNSCSSKICTIEASTVIEDGRLSTGSHDYSRRSSANNNCLESYRDDELEYTSFDEDEDDLAMSMSQEIVATQIFDTEQVETSEIHDVTNYGDVELTVDLEKDVEKPKETVVQSISKIDEKDTQETDTSYDAVPNIFNSTIEENDEDVEMSSSQDSQKTILFTLNDPNLVITPIVIPDDESCKETASKTIIKDPIPSTSKETNDQDSIHVPIHLPNGLTETRTISEDHDYLEKKLPMNFNLDVQDTEQFLQKNIDHIVSLANSLKSTDGKDNLLTNLSSLLNHISLIKDVTQTENEQEKVNVEIEKPENTSPNISDILVKEEYEIPEEDPESLVVKNLANDTQPPIIQPEKETMDCETTEESTLLEESLLVDPITNDIENLEKFAKNIFEIATNWRLAKETNLSKVQSVLKETDIEWRKLVSKFAVPRDVVDVGTEIDPKMFAKENARAKKDILDDMQYSESETEDLATDNETRQNILSIVEASYSDALESDLEEEMGKKRVKTPKTQSTENEVTNKDNSENNSSDEDSDASIDRLCNLKNLGRKIRETDRKYPSVPFVKKIEKKGLNVEELVNGVNDDEDGGGEIEEEIPLPPKTPITEAEFLKKINEEYKRQLLESSDSDLSDAESAISVDSEAHDSESSDSDSSIIMDRFLSSLDNNPKLVTKNGTKPPSLDSGLDEKSPPKTIVRRKSSIDHENSVTPDNKEDDDDALDLSMFKVATQRVKEIEELADLEADLVPDTSEPKVPNVEDYISLSSESEDETESEAQTRSRHTRKIMSETELAKETKDALEAEKSRMKRLEKMSNSLTQLLTQRPELEASELVLDYDKKNDMPISVHADIVRKLKPHQKEGVKFMYKNCYGPIDDIEKYPGSGCILAHCMGLGKTLQLIALLHTVIRYPRLKTNKILVLCPKSTIMNWFEEFERWIFKIKGTRKMKVFCFEESSTMKEKTKILSEWYSCGVSVKKDPAGSEWRNKTNNNSGQAGCLLLGYQAFRSLVTYNPRRKNARPMDEKEAKMIVDTIERCLIEPGADMVVCDEGHVIKNKNSGISKAVNQITTKRRIILTGTPIQNNLNEYYCMVNWIKPSFLGTEKEFNNRYANPIKQGQHKDSTPVEIRQMKRRSFVLHRKLEPFVERKEFTILKDELPEKHEYVLFVPLTEVQRHLYKLYLDKLKSNLSESEKIKGNHLLPDYTYLRKIWTHPRVLDQAYETSRANQGKKAAKNIEKLIERCDEEDLPDDLFDIAGDKLGVQEKWWERYLTREDLDTLVSSYKLQIMVEILKHCQEKGDKCLIFSNFVAVLNVVEFFLNKRMGYMNNRNYYRLDGQTPKARRHQLITRFNREDNVEVKCFLISARAGGQGINLIGANRVIILDTSWNPAADLQSIFRVYRLGQKKTCYIYRLLAMGTMEEKVYSRSVTKQAMSNRVVDEQQVDRHYSYGELAELYTLTDYDVEKRPMPDVPVDPILINLLRLYPRFIYKYHEHDSLLTSNDDEELTEDEKREAWDQYEREEKQQRANMLNPQDHQMPIGPYPNTTDLFSANMSNYLSNYGNLSNMGIFSQLMYNMDPYYGLLNQLPANNQQQQQQQPGSSLYNSNTNPLLAMGNMSSFAGSLANLSGGGITNASTGSPLGLGASYRPSEILNPSLYNSTTNDLLNGMRQRSSMSSFPAASPVRSHPINGTARSSVSNVPSEPVPVRLTSSAELQRSVSSGSTSSTTPTNKRKQQVRPSNQTAYEEQYLRHAVGNKRGAVDGSSSNVIEIPEDDHASVLPRNQNPPSSTSQTTAKVVKNANIGIHYPATKPKGTPIYLPDLPEGTSINKIPKNPTNNVGASTTSQQQIRQNTPAATITAVPNKQQQQQRQFNYSGTGIRTGASSTSTQSSKQPGNTFKPTQSGMQKIGNVSIIPTPRSSSRPSTSDIRSKQPQLTERIIPQIIPSTSNANISTSGATTVKKVVQQITQNSRGNTSITPVTRPSSIPKATQNLNLQGWKRKDPPTTNTENPVKMIRLNPNLTRK